MGTAFDGSRQYMPILWIIFHYRNQAFIFGDHGVREGALHPSDSSLSLRSKRPSGLPTSLKKFARRCKASAAIRQSRFNEESEGWSAPSRTPWSPNMKA